MRLNRRFFVNKLLLLAAGAFSFKSYAKAIEHIDSNDLSNKPDEFQKQLIKSNIDYQLAIEDAKDGDICASMYPAGGPLKAKCYSTGGV